MQSIFHTFIVWADICVFLASSKSLNHLNEDAVKLLSRSRREADFQGSASKAIAEEAKKLPLHRFLEDQIMIQTFDSESTTSIYTSPSDSSITFERESYDSGEDAIVLRDDKLPTTTGNQKKRIYVVLRKSPTSKKIANAHYFIFYAYLRDATEEELDAIQIDDHKYLIEWDSWDNRTFQTKSKLLGWLNCDASVLFSCKLNLSTVAEFESSVNKQEGRLLTRKKEFSAIVVEGFDSEEFFALYGDYDETIFEKPHAGFGRSMFSVAVKSETMCQNCKGNESIYKPPKLVSSTHENSLDFGNTLGMFFEGLQDSSMGLFIPHLKGVKSIFAPDSEDTENMPLIHGMLYGPPDVISPLTFISDRKSMVKNFKNLKGTMVPDEMMEGGLEGGIHGSLSVSANGATFVPELLPTNLYLSPKSIDPSKVYFPAALMQPSPGKETTIGEKSTGVLFEGLQGHLNIFIPSNTKVNGYFVPEDASSDLNDAIHGSLIPSNGSGVSIFEIENKGPDFPQAYGSFIPDDLPSGGFISGTMVKVENTLTFTPKEPAKEFTYDPADIIAANRIWVATTSTMTTEYNSSLSLSSITQHSNGLLFEGNPPMFFPRSNAINGYLVMDKDSSKIHGTLFPSTRSSKFTPEDPETEIYLKKKSARQKRCRFVPDPLYTDRNEEKIGIKGKFFPLNMSFVAENLGKGWFYDSKNPTEGVWTPTIVEDSKDEDLSRNKKPLHSSDFPEGVFYKGKVDKYGIFIPENEGVPGIIVPEKTMYAPMKGVFYAGEKDQPAGFYLEDPKQISSSVSMPATFSADGITHPAQGIKGISTSVIGSKELSFHPDVPSKTYLFDPNDPENAQVWTPFIPGITQITENYGVVDEEESAAASEYGHLFSDIGADDGVFLRFDTPVIGTIIFSSRKFPKIPGKMIVRNNGKSPEYYPDDLASSSTLFNVRGIFMPDGLPRIFAGLRGFFTAGIEGESGTFRTDLTGEFHVYSEEKDEENGIWKPPDSDLAGVEKIEINAAPKNGPTAATAMLKSFVQGAYFHGEHSGSIFISNDGKIGFLSDSSKKRIHGVLYPEEPPKFVSDDKVHKIGFQNMSSVKFAMESSKGEQANTLLGIFMPGTELTPPTFLPSKSYSQGWTNFHVAKPSSRENNYVYANGKWTNNFKTKEGRILKNGIIVGGGYKGFETDGKSYDGLMDANSPTFREFLERRSAVFGRESGKYSEIPTNIFLATSDDKNKIGVIASTIDIIKASDYRSWLMDTYMITKTHITTQNINATVEICVPKAAKGYLKVKPKKKRFNVIIDTAANAVAGASGNSGGSAKGGVTTQIGNCKPITTSAQAAAQATNGGSAQAEASAKQGGNSNALAIANNGASSKAKADSMIKGQSNSKATADNGGKASAISSNVGGGKANAVANSQRGKDVDVEANAKSPLRKTRDASGKDCQDDFVDEIVVESSAVANAMASEDGGSASANTQVRVNLAGLVAKMMTKEEEADDDDESETVDIHINANSAAQSGRSVPRSGRSMAQSGRSMFGLGLGISLPSLFPWQSKPIAKKKKIVKTNDKPGWKTEHRVIKENVTLRNEDVIFYGFGSCPFYSQLYSQLQNTEKPEEIIEFYLNITRTGCIKKEKMRVLLLVVDSLLEFDDKILVIPSTHSYRNERKLTAGEMNSFSRAFELSMFTKTYIFFGENQDSNATEPVSPDGTPISRSIRFITELTLTSVDERNFNFPMHLVRLTRNNIVTLRTVLTKLHMDKRRLDKCKECVLDLELNYYDRFQITALLHFLISGLAPVVQGNIDPREAFNSFYVTNKLALKERVNNAFSMLN